jgi:sugar (pentulose or hexulose) kinase
MYILSIDLGTQSIRGAVVSKDGGIKGISRIPHDVRSPRAGWAEQRPDSWWRGVKDAIRGVLDETGVPAKSIAGVVSCGQMHGPVGIASDGRVTTKWTQLWNDKRCEEQCIQLRENHDTDELAKITGNRPTAGWVGMKVAWIKEHMPDVYKRSSRFLVPKDFINFRLTGKAATDPSEASDE